MAGARPSPLLCMRLHCALPVQISVPQSAHSVAGTCDITLAQTVHACLWSRSQKLVHNRHRHHAFCSLQVVARCDRSGQPQSQLHQRKSSRAAALIAHPGWEWRKRPSVGTRFNSSRWMASYGYLAAIEGGSSSSWRSTTYSGSAVSIIGGARTCDMAGRTWRGPCRQRLLALVAAYPTLSGQHAGARDVLIALPRILLLFRTSRWRRAQRGAPSSSSTVRSSTPPSPSSRSRSSSLHTRVTCSTGPRCRGERHRGPVSTALAP